MARLTSLLTWLVMALMAAPVAVAAPDVGGLAREQMSMSCDHAGPSGMAMARSGQYEGQAPQPCCAECDMPDCSAGSSGPVLNIVAAAGPDTILQGPDSYKIAGDLLQISNTHETPRKPPRV